MNRITRAILSLINKGHKISFKEDFGKLTMTVYIDNSHTHVGWPDCTEEQFEQSLYNALTSGPGLSFSVDH